MQISQYARTGINSYVLQSYPNNAYVELIQWNLSVYSGHCNTDTCIISVTLIFSPKYYFIIDEPEKSRHLYYKDTSPNGDNYTGSTVIYCITYMFTLSILILPLLHKWWSTETVSIMTYIFSVKHPILHTQIDNSIATYCSD